MIKKCCVTRKFYFVSTCLLPMLLVETACNSGTGSAPDDGRATVSSQDAPTPKRGNPPSKTPAIDAPLRAPAAYFGELPLKRLPKPLHRKPHTKSAVVLIVIDALNAKHLGAYGYPRRTSPHLDTLAREGLMFSNHVSNSSWTRPSFATIVTGLPKDAHHVELKNSDIDMDITTVAERFRMAGYRTAGFVGNPLVRKAWGFGQGFQVYEDTASLKDVFPPDRRLVDKAVAWLRTVSDAPFFLMLFLTAPHTPYSPATPHFLAKMPEGKTVRYPFREYKEPLDKKTHDSIVAAYDDEIRYSDQQIGRLLAYLEEIGRKENTTVVVTADHGEAFGDHNCYTHTYHMWESVLRVPLIIHSPFIVEHGVIIDRPFTHIDLAPTLLDLAGIGLPEEGLPGTAIVQAMGRPSDGEDRTLFSQYNAHGIQRQAIRDRRWKLIHHHKVDASALDRMNSLEGNVPHADPKDLPSLATDFERFELYDLATDPGELHDLFASKRSTAPALALMNALRSRLDPEQEPGTLSKELIEALENAGYLQAAPSKKRRSIRGTP